jgi:hypothetical protein
MMGIRKTITMAAMTGAMIGAPLLLTTATAQADTVNWDAIAQCESGGNWGTNTGNGAFGGLQFKQATWTSNGGVGSPAGASRADQIRVAENVLRTQGIGAWPKCGAYAASPVTATANPAVYSTNPAVYTASTPAATGCSQLGTSFLGVMNLEQLCSAVTAPVHTVLGSTPTR